MGITFENTNFAMFADFASKVSGGTRVSLDTMIDGEGGDTKTHTVSASKNWDFVGNIKRNAAKRELNDQVRTFFLDAVSELFGGEDHIPDNVKEAMKMQNFGKGKPLTARRIIAVKKAIEAVRNPTTYLDYSSDVKTVTDTMKANALKCVDVTAKYKKSAEKGGPTINDGINAVIDAADDDIELMNVLKDDLVIGKMLDFKKDIGEIKNMVAGVKANVDELRKATDGDKSLFCMGLRCIIGMKGKQLDDGVITSIVNKVKVADISELRKMNGSSSVMQIHNSISQYLKLQDEIMMESKALRSYKHGVGADDMAAVKKFIGRLLIARCSDTNQKAFLAALGSEACGKLQTVYSQVGESSIKGDGFGRDLSMEWGRQAYQFGSVLGEISTIINGEDKKDKTVADPAEGRKVISPNSSLYSKIASSLYSRAEANLKMKTETILNEFVPSKGQGSDIIRDKFAAILKSIGINNNAQAILKQQMCDITMNGIHYNIMTNAKDFATAPNIESTLFARDLKRLSLKGTITVGGEPLRGEPTEAADQIAKFVTKGTTNKNTFAELDGKERMKAFVLMSLITQNTTQTLSRNMFSALDPKKNTTPFTLIDDGADGGDARTNLQMNFTIDDKGDLKVEAKCVNYIRTVLDGPYAEPNNEEMMRSTDNRTITTGFELTLSKRAFEQYANLGEKKTYTDTVKGQKIETTVDITDLDYSEAKKREQDDNIENKSQQMVASFAKYFQIPKNGVKCLTSCEVNLN